jgi:hypothetical protein
MGGDSPGQSKLDADQPAKSPNPKSVMAQIHQKLGLPIPMEAGVESDLRDVLDFLSERYGINFQVNTEAFKQDEMAEVEKQMVKLRKMPAARLDTVLRLLLAQLNATYLVRTDHIEITTLRAAANEVWGTLEVEVRDDVSTRKRPMMRLVHVTFEKSPLDEALRQLSESTGTSIVLDTVRVGDKSKTNFSLSLNNVPLDTAVRILANQAGLKSILVDNVICVTTEQNADTLQREQERANGRGLE